ncbi:MAG: hypothetical protein JRN26_01715 [Nitrososphaerota archaeon]|jgi:hypothetical protein|nr:hypothetical protein [Nitrososphaerota archaeon]MDG6935595.1 hypothetical protein [Nitrososphaerota archaeon]MDG6944039.1 hypothetical protein [Nitrososphaerota archaeon]
MNQPDKLDRIIKQIISQRGDLSESDVRELIKAKKSEVGAGFLTDLGAIYLILNELGIKIEQKQSLAIGEIDLDRKVADIECYYLSSAKLPGRVVFYVFDSGSVLRGVLWGNGDAFDVLRAGQGVTLKNAVVRESAGGAFELHLNDKSEIVKRPDIKGVEYACSELKSGGPGVYRGTVEGPMRVISFKKRDGSDGRGLAFFLKIGEQRVRTVIWTQKELEIYEGHELVIGPLIVKKDNYGTELSGDDSTVIEVVGPRFTLVDGKDKRFIAVHSSGKMVELEFDAPPAGKSIIAKKFEMRYPNFRIHDYEQVEGEIQAPRTSKISESAQGLVKIDFITLSDPAKKGSGYYEILVGDDSGEGKLIADNYNLVSMLSVGQKATATGVHGDGKRNFRVTPYTVIKPISA